MSGAQLHCYSSWMGSTVFNRQPLSVKFCLPFCVCACVFLQFKEFCLKQYPCTVCSCVPCRTMVPPIRSCSEARMTGSWRNSSSGRISTRYGSQSCQGHNSYSSDSTDSGYGDMPAAFCGRSTGRSEKMTRQDYEELEELVMKHFDKKFSFAPPLWDWKLPEPSEMFVAERWKVSDWKSLSCRLRVVVACQMYAFCSQQFTGLW